MDVECLSSCPLVPLSMSSVKSGFRTETVLAVWREQLLLHVQGATAFWEVMDDFAIGPHLQRHGKGVWLRAANDVGACSAPAWLPLSTEPDEYAPPLRAAFQHFQGAELEGALEQTGVIGRVSFFRRV